MVKFCAAVVVAVFMSGCTSQVYPTIDATLAVIDNERRATLDRIEDRRCKRPPHWVADLAERRGDDWLLGYVRSCPNWRSLIMRIIGLEIRARGLGLIE